ncbi:MAG: transcription antitermination factor NusB [Oscillospiraceae bacterium]|nr:transcription antitermination factor NusB [Oscillospiraceae bacterium]
MTRSNARELAVHLIFEQGFSEASADELLEGALKRSVFETLEGEPLYAEFPNQAQRAYIEQLVRGVEAHRAELDGYIEQYAIGWRLSRLPRTVVAILRVCMYEILYMQDVPNAAAINEAVEMTKHYEESELSSFVNGILGSFVRSEPLPRAETEAMPADAFDPEPVPEEPETPEEA